MFGDLPSYGLYIRHANSLTLRNVQLAFIEDDFRHALFAEDAGNLVIDGLRAQCAPAGSAQMLFKGVRAALISGCAPDSGVAPFLEVTGDGNRGIALMNNDLRRVRDPVRVAGGSGDDIVAMEANLLP